MIDNLVENLDIAVSKKTENVPKDIFFEELARWKGGVVEGSLTSLERVCSRMKGLEENLDVNDDDLNLIKICSSLLGFRERCGRMDRQDAKLKSVKIQQDACTEILSRFHDGKFDDDKAPIFFQAMSEIFNKLKSHDLLRDGFQAMAGLRGMVSAELLFTMADYDVTMPQLKMDANYDIDLIISKRGKKFGLSVKSLIEHINPQTHEAFEVRRMEKPRDFPAIYSEGLDGYLWTNIPSQSTEDAACYCEKGPLRVENLAIGLPTKISADFLNKDLSRIQIPE